MLLAQDFVVQAMLRLLLAAVLGAIIGIERERKRKPAGLRTIMLITLGSALFVMLSEFLAKTNGGDPQRIAAQLIPGIGFLGAGAILQSRGNVVGLTTAAIIFVSASIGMACGGGMVLIAVGATVLLVLLIIFMEKVEKRFEKIVHNITFSVETRQPQGCISNIERLANMEDFKVRDLRIRQQAEVCLVEFSVRVPQQKLSDVVEKVQELRRSHD